MNQREGFKRFAWICYAAAVATVLLFYDKTPASRPPPAVPVAPQHAERPPRDVDDLLLSLVRERAEAGEPSAIETMAAWYESRDPAQAARWYEKLAAARPDDPRPPFRLGELYEGLRQNAKAFTHFRRAAELGLAEAQYNLGFFYAVGGHGVTKDEAEAVRWWRKAAEQGHADSRNLLAQSYLDGDGVDKDEAEAVRQWRIAAGQGDLRALNSLANAYYSGQGVKEDKAEAVRLYRAAAERGGGHAQHVLGILYKNGDGVEKNMAEAVKWWRLAVANGEHLALNGLAMALFVGDGVPADPAEALRLWRQSADWDDYARDKLGVAYAEGKGVEKDMAEAVKWWRQAAAGGFGPAQHSLGDAYAAGDGVEQDMGQAVKWWREAAARGQHGARKKLLEQGEQP